VRTALVVLNLLVASASGPLFAYTFFARDHLTGLAEEYVVAKTVAHAAPAVEQVERALARPEALLAPAAVRAAVREEVDAFRADPPKYVRALVAARGAAIEKPKHPFAEKVVAWKEQVRAYFDKTLAGLVRDLRIFAGTNLVAALLAALFAWRANGRWRRHVLGVSGLLLGALALNASMFIDKLTFFRIVADRRVGWVYPVFVALTFVDLYIRYGRRVPLAPEPAANPSGPQKPAAVR
jgi:hypothetical protein